ncbi:MAG TPA: DUF2007 domain-containing protein [Steroidobacteraceae bacterium]|nr:DUF2007 domain-containing protein [Steroidobacteraceae bacterium]
MRKVFSSELLIEVSHLKNVLETEGIRCQIRNDRLSGALGEIPFLECWPELWLVDPGDELRARGLIEAELADAPVAPAWTCPDCGERIEGQFAECWRCAERALEEK